MDEMTSRNRQSRGIKACKRSTNRRATRQGSKRAGIPGLQNGTDTNPGKDHPTFAQPTAASVERRLDTWGSGLRNQPRAGGGKRPALGDKTKLKAS